jgi:cytochrome c biogenesis protein CcmG/thiol:disulfide interchange protein DsbE
MKLKIQLLGIIIMLFSTLQVNAQQTPQWLDKLDLTHYPNKVIYLDFWASWCGPCRKSFPWLNSMQEKYKEKGLVVIGINLDRDINTAQAFLKNTPANFLLYSDPNSEFAKKYQLIGMPSSYLISADGQISERHVGFKQSKVALYEANIVKLLNQLPENQ